MNEYPRETVEFQQVTVVVDGVPTVDNVMFAVTEVGVRPSDWIAPVTIGTEIGVMVEGLAPGHYQVWAQVSASPEIPVINCGAFRVT